MLGNFYQIKNTPQGCVSRLFIYGKLLIEQKVYTIYINCTKRRKNTCKILKNKKMSSIMVLEFKREKASEAMGEKGWIRT